MIDIEFLKSALKENALHMSMAKVQTVEIAPDRSYMRAKVLLMPTLYEAKCYVGAEYTAPGAGLFLPLRPDDLVLVGFPLADPENGVLIKRLTSREDTIPEEFNNDKVVLKCAGPETFAVVCDSIKLGSDGTTENLVLGQVLKTFLSSLLSELSAMAASAASHTHISSMPGYPSEVPDVAGDFSGNQGIFDSLKSSPVEDEVILSDIAWTEKG